jgi:phospholipase/carboxylesterase
MLKNGWFIVALFLLMHVAGCTQNNQLNEDLSLKYLVQLPAEKAEHPPVIIVLHGRGSNEEDLFSLRDKFPKNYLVVFARAPYHMYMNSYQWFDMVTDSGKHEGNVQNLAYSRNLLTKFITEVINKYHADPKQVYMAGFSQGGMMSYEVGLTAPDKLKGIGVLSGSLFESLLPLIKVTPALKNLKIFVAHGTADKRVNFEYGQQSVDYLRSIGLNPDFHTYHNMTHEVKGEEIDDLVKWLAN